MKTKTKKVVNTTKNQEENNNKKRKILLGTLIPFGVLALTASIVTPTVICCKNRTNNSNIELESGVSSKGVTVAESHIAKDTDSSFTLNVPTGVAIKDIKLSIDGQTYTTHDGIQIDGTKILVPASLMKTNKIIVNDITLDAVTPAATMTKAEWIAAYKPFSDNFFNSTVEYTVDDIKITGTYKGVKDPNVTKVSYDKSEDEKYAEISIGKDTETIAGYSYNAEIIDKSFLKFMEIAYDIKYFADSTSATLKMYTKGTTTLAQEIVFNDKGYITKIAVNDAEEGETFDITLSYTEPVVGTKTVSITKVLNLPEKWTTDAVGKTFKTTDEQKQSISVYAENTSEDVYGHFELVDITTPTTDPLFATDDNLYERVTEKIIITQRFVNISDSDWKKIKDGDQLALKWVGNTVKSANIAYEYIEAQGGYRIVGSSKTTKIFNVKNWRTIYFEVACPSEGNYAFSAKLNDGSQVGNTATITYVDETVPVEITIPEEDWSKIEGDVTINIEVEKVQQLKTVSIQYEFDKTLQNAGFTVTQCPESIGQNDEEETEIIFGVGIESGTSLFPQKVKATLYGAKGNELDSKTYSSQIWEAEHEDYVDLELSWNNVSNSEQLTIKFEAI